MLKGGSMSKVNNDYTEKDVIDFLKEEFERIITKYPRQSRGSTLNDAQALAIWFLHQEVGIDYEEINKYILDDTNDCGVDVIWIDKNNHQILVCQIEYDTKDWSKNPADQKKATETFNENSRALKWKNVLFRFMKF